MIDNELKIELFKIAFKAVIEKEPIQNKPGYDNKRKENLAYIALEYANIALECLLKEEKYRIPDENK